MGVEESRKRLVVEGLARKDDKLDGWKDNKLLRQGSLLDSL